jgi:hypothetical protein
MIAGDHDLYPGYGDAGIAEMSASPAVVEAAIPVKSLLEYLREPDGSPSSALPDKVKPQVANLLFLEFLTYLSDKRYRYTLGPGLCFWYPGGLDYQKPEGNCDTVAKSFLLLLWAYGFGIDDLKLYSLECPPDSERIVGKKHSEAGGVSRPHAGLDQYFNNLDKRGFKPSKGTGRLEALKPPRNPYQMHVIGHVEHGGVDYKYYDAITGLTYSNPRNYFRVYKKGGDYEYIQNRVTRRMEMYYDEAGAKRRIYRLPDALVGEVDGGVWVIVDDEDWAVNEFPVHLPKRAKPPGLLEYCLHMPANAFLYNLRK